MQSRASSARACTPPATTHPCPPPQPPRISCSAHHDVAGRLLLRVREHAWAGQDAPGGVLAARRGRLDRARGEGGERPSHARARWSGGREQHRNTRPTSPSPLPPPPVPAPPTPHPPPPSPPHTLTPPGGHRLQVPPHGRLPLPPRPRRVAHANQRRLGAGQGACRVPQARARGACVVCLCASSCVHGEGTAMHARSSEARRERAPFSRCCRALQGWDE